jgi:cytochrome c553
VYNREARGGLAESRPATSPEFFIAMTLTIRTVCLLLAMASASSAFAKGDAAAGATKAVACFACHGANGNSVNPHWPKLAGQNAAYIERQLKLFHDGVEKPLPTDTDGILMPPMAAPLSEQDMADVAAYFALQTPTGAEADPALYQAGQKLFHGGDRNRNIPACAACHGPLGAGNPGAGFPALRAQSSMFTMRQLGHYRDKSRYTQNAKGGSNGGDYAEIMQTIASRLSEDEIKSLAAYIQGMR